MSLSRLTVTLTRGRTDVCTGAGTKVPRCCPERLGVAARALRSVRRSGVGNTPQPLPERTVKEDSVLLLRCTRDRAPTVRTALRAGNSVAMHRPSTAPGAGTQLSYLFGSVYGQSHGRCGSRTWRVHTRAIKYSSTQIRGSVSDNRDPSTHKHTPRHRHRQYQYWQSCYRNGAP